METGLRGPEAAQDTQHPALESPSFRARMGGDPLPPYTPSLGEGESDGSGPAAQALQGRPRPRPRVWIGPELKVNWGLLVAHARHG